MTSELIYHLNLLPYSREELLLIVKEKVSEKRFKHILGVEKASIKLAKAYGDSVEKASIAALLHDYCKELSDELFIEEIKKNKLDCDLLNWNNNIWHGMVGRYIIENEIDLHDESILNAIEIHTTGAKKMSKLAKILYIADYIEEGRNFTGVKKAREIANKSLDEAVAYETSHTLLHLMEQRLSIYPLTIQTYNYYCVK